jgi:tRNA-modifying protein YgfZ
VTLSGGPAAHVYALSLKNLAGGIMVVYLHGDETTTMRTAWQAFLTERGAKISAGMVERFGTHEDTPTPQEQSTIICDLSHYSVIAVTGDDAQTLLQGQLTNDVSAAERGKIQFTGLCSPKGRLLASMLLAAEFDGYTLHLPGELAQAIQKRLAMYVLRAKVKLSDASERTVRIGVAGVDAAPALAHLSITAPSQDMTVSNANDLTVFRLPGERYVLSVIPERAAQVWDQLATIAQPAGKSSWELLGIKAGIACILSGTQDMFVPQMVNFDLIGGISFDKGCYTGQEIVARTRYLGKLKRRMYLAQIDTTGTPLPGEALYSVDFGDQAMGAIVNAEASPLGGYEVLAVIQIDSAQQPVHWKQPNGPLLRIAPLPYSL